MSLKTTFSLVTLFAVSEVMVVLASIYGPFLLGYSDHADLTVDTLVSSVCRCDAIRYVTIAKEGYDYEIGRVSTIGYLPGYPMLVSLVSRVSLIQTATAAMIVANVCLLCAMFALAIYGSARSKSTTVFQSVAAFVLFPTTFFFRMPYSESLFLCFCLLFVLGIEKHWSPAVVAAFAGIASGIRPAGVALIVPLLMYVDKKDQPLNRRLAKGAAITLLGCGGLLMFLCYNYVAFGDPIAFVKVQSAIRLRTDDSFMDKLLAHLSLEPIWSVYDHTSPAYWQIGLEPDHSIFSLHFADPIIFLFVTFIIGFGCWKHYLTAYEIAVAIGFLAIPYFTKGYEMGMLGQGRYAAACFPSYFVIGGFLQKAGAAVTIFVYGAFAFYLCLYTILFTSGYTLS